MCHDLFNFFAHRWIVDVNFFSLSQFFDERLYLGGSIEEGSGERLLEEVTSVWRQKGCRGSALVGGRHGGTG